MCGIVGAVGVSTAGVPYSSLLQRLLKLSETRGKEAAGLAVASSERISVLKQANSAAQMLRTKECRGMLQSLKATTQQPVVAFGHCRLVTNGLLEVHDNNQPVILDQIVGVHNGIVVNDQLLWQQHPELSRQFQVDTEVILALLRHYSQSSDSLPEAVTRVYQEIQGVANIAALMTDSDYLLLASNNGSLYLASDGYNQLHVFASEEYTLREAIRHQGLEARLGNFTVTRVGPQAGALIHLTKLTAERFAFGEMVGAGNGVPRVDPTVSRQIVQVSRPAPVAAPKRVHSFLGNISSSHYEECVKAVCRLRRCTHCVQPETLPYIDLDENGVCWYCRTHKDTQFKGMAEFEKLLAPYRRLEGPDCLIPLSGGRDSCYSLHVLKEMGMNPVAYTYDWGMVTDLARRNCSRMCARLGIEHILVSANIARKRDYIRRNVEAWLRTPDLGTVPLFMAGDKQFFQYANQLKKRTGVEALIFAMHPLERTDFKHGFCNIQGGGAGELYFRLPVMESLKIALYYGLAFLKNPAYLNRSLLDTLWAYLTYYVFPHNYLRIYDYIPWEENRIVKVLCEEYDWETDPGTSTTWRIGDGTAAFYNYIYFVVAGFTENDVLRSNQVRDGHLTREQALRMVNDENQPRVESLAWYCQTIGVDLAKCLDVIHKMPKLYPIG